MSCDPEIQSGFLDIYLAPVGEAMPGVDEVPAGNWSLLGSTGGAGADRYSEDGVHVESDITANNVMSVKNTLPECKLITAQELRVRVELFDISAEELNAAFNFNAVSVDAGPPAINTLSLVAGNVLQARALLVRGETNSSAAAGLPMQVEFPRIVSLGAIDLAWVKGDPVMAALTFEALISTIQIINQTA